MTDQVINWKFVNQQIIKALQATVPYIPLTNFIPDNQSVEAPKYPYVVYRPVQHYVRLESIHHMDDESFDHVLGVTAVDPDNDRALQVIDTIGTLIQDLKYKQPLRKFGIYVVDVSDTQEAGIHLRAFNTNYTYYLRITFRIKRNAKIARIPIETIEIPDIKLNNHKD